MKMNAEFQFESTKTIRPEWWDGPETVYSVGVSGGKDSTAVLLWLIHNSGVPKEKIDATFCDTGNEHDWTYQHVELLSKTVHPIKTLKPEKAFFDLAFSKHRFPSTKARFCTEHLKIIPSQDHVQELKKSGKRVIGVSGVRANESEDRKNLPEWDFSGTLLCHQWRPLITWTLDDVLAIHRLHGVPLNPLYSLGAQRVGCWPCIMSRKSEIRTIALKFPERIDEIRKAEQSFVKAYGRYSSFFPRNTVPKRFRSLPYIDKGVPVMEDITELRDTGTLDADGHSVFERVKIGEEQMMIATIDDVVKWSLTGHRAQGSYLDEPETEKISCNSGFCE